MKLRPALAGASVCAFLAMAGTVFAQDPAPKPDTAPASHETLFYGAEWRFVRAGEVEVRIHPGVQTDMKLRTLGIVNSLFSVNNTYRAEFGARGCVVSTLLEAHEGKKHTESRVTYDYAKQRAFYLEKNLVKDAVVTRSDIEIPDCIHDLIGALGVLRRSNFAGQTISIPLSDGKKAIKARIEPLAKEQVTTPMGTYRTQKVEAFLFNGEFFRRSGRLFLWISEDDRRLPVRIRIQLPFYIGTVTLTLEKAERN